MLQMIQDTDWMILHWIRDNLRTPVGDTVFPLITSLGNAGIFWIITGVLLLFSKKYRKWGLTMLLALLAGHILGNVLIKNIVQRARPCWVEKVVLLISNPKDYSFPSGHTLSSFTAAYVLSKADKRFGYIAIPLAALIAFSRLYLFVHFPSDVITGLILGLIIGAIAVLILNSITRKRNI